MVITDKKFVRKKINRICSKLLFGKHYKMHRHEKQLSDREVQNIVHTKQYRNN